MNVSLYQAAAAMNASERWQDVIAQNLAASPIPGARKRDMSFSAVEAGMAAGLSGAGSRYLMPVAAPTINFQPGELRPTNQPTDLAIDGPGFFEVQLPNGVHAYTRDGELKLNGQGQLVTKQGCQLVSDSGLLKLDPANPSPITVSPTGEVSQGAQVIGRLKVTEFPQLSVLRGIGDGYFITSDPTIKGDAAQSSRVRQGSLESANVSPTIEMGNMLSSMRMFEANQKVVQALDDRMGRVINDLGNPSA
jgi:flagellar basal-body rod protein FlgF